MPVARGKKKTRRERRRFGSPYAESPGGVVAPVATSSRTSSRVSRTSKASPSKRPPLPLWANAAIGSSMLLFGVFFAVSSLNTKGGLSNGWQPVIFVGYALVASIYLGRAVRQYRERRESS